MTEAIERLKRAREDITDSHNSNRYAKTLEERGWYLDPKSPLWRHPLHDEPQGTYSAISIEQRSDLAELIAAVDAVVKGEMEQ